MVLQDLGRRINAAVTNVTREPNLDEKVRSAHPGATELNMRRCLRAIMV